MLQWSFYVLFLSLRLVKILRHSPRVFIYTPRRRHWQCCGAYLIKYIHFILGLWVLTSRLQRVRSFYTNERPLYRTWSESVVHAEWVHLALSQTCGAQRGVYSILLIKVLAVWHSQKSSLGLVYHSSADYTYDKREMINDDFRIELDCK